MAIVKTFTVEKDVVFSDGEALTSADFNLANQLPIGMYSELIRQAEVSSPVTIRPVRDALHCYQDSSGYVVNFSGGMVIADPGTGYTAVLVDAYSETLPTPTDNVTYRYTMTVTEDTRSETRSFEDASTGALTTSSTVKANRLIVNIHRVNGTDAASPSTPAWPPGEIPLAQVTCGVFSGEVHQMRDYRIPAGETTIFAPAMATGPNYSEWDLFGHSSGDNPNSATMAYDGSAPANSYGLVASWFVTNNPFLRLKRAYTSELRLPTYGAFYFGLVDPVVAGATTPPVVSATSWEWVPDQLGTDSPMWGSGTTSPLIGYSYSLEPTGLTVAIEAGTTDYSRVAGWFFTFYGC